MAIVRAAVVGISLVLVSAAVTTGLAAGPQKKSSYKKVDALFQAKCMPCHSSSHHKEGVDLSSYKATMASHKIVIAGKPDKSDLLLYINGTKKPLMPMGGKMLPAADIKLVATWIKGGAKP